MRTNWIAAAVGIALSATPVIAAGPSYLTLLTGGPDGVYYPLGIAIGKIFGDEMADRTVRVRVTQGSVANLTLLAEGKGELGFAVADTLAAAREGNAAAGFPDRLMTLRSIGALYPNYIQIVATAKSGIRSLADLRGKTLSVGAPQSGTELNAHAVLAAAGIDAKDVGKLERLSFAESVTRMKEGKLDVTLQSAGLGAASLNELSNSGDIVMVPIPRDLVEKMGPPFMPATIPANTYRGQNADVPTASVMNYLVTRADVPDDIIAQMTGLIFDRLDELGKAHPAARAISLQRAMREGPIPLHPGAMRYFREKRTSACAAGAAFEDAIAGCSVVLADDATPPPARVQALLLRAAAYAGRSQRDRPRALADLAAAMRIDPQHAAARAAYKALAQALEREGVQMPIKPPSGRPSR